MSEYQGFIALVPRKYARRWIEEYASQAAVPALLAFAIDTTWVTNQPTIPALGRRLQLDIIGKTYVAQHYTTFTGEVLVVACRYAAEWIAPSGMFAVDRGQDYAAKVFELVNGDLDAQIKQALTSAK